MPGARQPFLWLLTLALGVLPLRPVAAAEPGSDPYGPIDALFRQHCLDCHAAQEPEGKLILESFDTLMKGGESGAAVVPGRSAQSLVAVAVESGLERDGRRKIMPPGKRTKLTRDEVTLLKRWIDSGAPPPSPAARAAARDLSVPRVLPKVPPPRAIRAAAYSPALQQFALARHAEVELISIATRQVVHRLTRLRGAVTALAFSPDGQTLAVAAGEPALFGQATLWRAASGELIRTVEGHADALYAIALSPDNRVLATGSYDQKIKLWDVATGELRHTLSAHNAAIYGLAFRPDGKILASASGDRTIKLWQTDTGKRVETLGQPLQEVHALAWSPDGRRLAAAGLDHRIRIWEISEAATETTNPLLLHRFAHEGAILNLKWAPDGKSLLSSADDQTVKLWDAAQVTEKRTIEKQPDLAPALAFLDGSLFVAGRMDGTWEIYDSTTGKPVPQPAPGLRRVEPRGVQQGKRTTLTLLGTNLTGITNVSASHPQLHLTSFSATNPASATVVVEAAPDLPRGAHEIWVRGPAGASGRVAVYVDNVPQLEEGEATQLLRPPVAVWGALTPSGDTDEVRFEAAAGQSIVLELAARTVGAKIQNGAVALYDAEGTRLASDAGFDGEDRLVAFSIPTNGTYRAHVSDQMLATSADSFYRLTIGALPVITGVFPLAVPTNAATTVHLIGYNLPPDATVRVTSSGPGDLAVPVDRVRYRAARDFKVTTVPGAVIEEKEPNDRGPEATPLPNTFPVSANGRIQQPGDADLFRFEARRGQRLIVETDAARRGSPIDTRLEILALDGQAVPSLLLQAVRNTAINFRGVDSNGTGLRLDNYEEMELNEYLFLNGDVMRLFRMPQGPDSDMVMYASTGKRQAYFNTTAVSHALDEPGYIVEPHPPGARLVPNGLPVFTLHHENDDDGERLLGADSRVHFVAPADGAFLVRVTDTRGQGGDRLAYRLVLRQAEPGFTMSIAGVTGPIAAGSGQAFTVTAERRDGFNGEIHVAINGLPPGFIASSPLTIEAGQSEAKGTLFAARGAVTTTNTSSLRLRATATIDGHSVTQAMNWPGQLQVGPAPKVYVTLEPDSASSTNNTHDFDPGSMTTETAPLELTVRPGGSVPAWLKIHRRGHGELVTFFAENLPHGVIVADIGLNGVLIPKDESARRIFFEAAKWVGDQDRLFYMIEQQAGRQTSRPILLKVRRPSSQP
jgi:WD40 repeat protein